MTLRLINLTNKQTTARLPCYVPAPLSVSHYDDMMLTNALRLKRADNLSEAGLCMPLTSIAVEDNGFATSPSAKNLGGLHEHALHMRGQRSGRSPLIPVAAPPSVPRPPQCALPFLR